MPLPKFEHCIVCDAIRPEPGGKATILGFLGLTPNVELRLLDINLPTADIAFLIIGGKGGGSCTLSLEIEDANGAEVFKSPLSSVVMEEKDRTNVSFNLRTIKFPHQGRYKVRLLMNSKQAFSDTFVVNQATPDEIAKAKGEGLPN